jgi:DNA-binding transcriptional LysR family regulator
MLNLEWVRGFLVFADHLNLTRAAETLNLSQPALHAQIGKLADELGVPLYRRVGRQLALTVEGERVARFGRQLIELTDGFLSELRGTQSRQPVVLAAGEGAYLYLLGPAIESFLAAAVARLRLLTTDGQAGLDAVRSGRAHLAVAALDGIPEDLDVHPIATIGQVLVVPLGHPLAGQSIALGDLEGMRLIVPPPGRPHRQTLERALRTAGVPWEIAVEASGWELMLHFVSLGLGAAVVNSMCRIPVGFAAAPIPALPVLEYMAVHRRGRLANPGAALLLDHIRRIRHSRAPRAKS